MSRRGVGLAAHVRDAEGRLETLVLAEPHVLDDAVRERLPTRLRLVKRLQHPGLVAVVDGGVDNGDGHPWLVEQASSGRTLRKLLEEEGHLDPLDALQVAVDLLNALEYVHRQGLLHGGLSPNQVLVSRREGRLRGRVLEPGLAQLLGTPRSTPFGPVRVDPDYAAPEAVRGEPLTAAADVYSVGILLHEALTGRHPIPAPARNRLLHRLNEPSRRLDEGTFADEARDEAVRLALSRAETKDPAKRYASARDFALALTGRPAEAELGQAVAPAGAPCAGCDAEILPLERRTWGRHDSDRPFQCVRCAKVFCGGSHWDPLGRTCRECSERDPAYETVSVEDAVRLDDAVSLLPPVSTPEGEGPTGSVETAETEAERRERVRTKARRPSERLLALRELLTSSKGGPAAAESGAESRKAPPTARQDPNSQAGTGDLMVDAWAREKERHTKALARAEEARARSGRAGRSEVAEIAVPIEAETERLPRPPAGETRRPGSGAHKRPSSGTHKRPDTGKHRRPSSRGGVSSGTGRVADGRPMGRPASAPIAKRDRQVWRLVSGVLSVALAYMAWAWHGELERFADSERALQQELATLKSSSTDAALAGQRGDVELRGLHRELEDVKRALAQTEANRADLEALAGERGQQLAETRQALATREDAQAQLERRAHELTASIGRLNADLKQRAAAVQAAEARIGELEADAAQQALHLEQSDLMRAVLQQRLNELDATTLPAELVPLDGDEPRVGGERDRRVLLRWADDPRELLRFGAEARSLVAVHLRLEGAPARLREAGQLGAGVPLRAGRLRVASTTVEDEDGLLVLRFWLDAAACARLRAEGLSFVVEADPQHQGDTRVVAAELVFTPLVDDAALRLQELERRGRW
jgi:hypothetical protein